MCHFLIYVGLAAASNSIHWVFLFSLARLTPLDAHNYIIGSFRAIYSQSERFFSSMNMLNSIGSCECIGSSYFKRRISWPWMWMLKGLMTWHALVSTSAFVLQTALHILGILQRIHHFPSGPTSCPIRKGHSECDISKRLSFKPIRKLILMPASGSRATTMNEERAHSRVETAKGWNAMNAFQ